MNLLNQQSLVDGVHEELDNIVEDLMDISVWDAKSRGARQKAISACMRARRRLLEAGLEHSVPCEKGACHG